MAKSKRSGKRSRDDAGSPRVFVEVMELASSLFNNRRDFGANHLNALAKTTRDYATTMSNLPTMQEQVNLVSDNIENFSDYVLNTDLQRIVKDISVQARRRPSLTVGVAVVAGVVATRFVFPSSTLPSKPFSRRTKKVRKSSGVVTRSRDDAAHGQD